MQSSIEIRWVVKDADDTITLRSPLSTPDAFRIGAQLIEMWKAAQSLGSKCSAPQESVTAQELAMAL